MTQKELLEYYLEMESENLFAASANYAMSRPKPGMGVAFSRAQEHIDLIEEMIAQINVNEKWQQETQERIEMWTKRYICDLAELIKSHIGMSPEEIAALWKSARTTHNVVPKEL